MLLFLFSILYSTKVYRDENQRKVTSIEFKDSKKTLYQNNFTNKDTPIHLIGRKNNQISVKKIEASKYIIIDSVTVNVDELFIDDVDAVPFKMINDGKILIHNSLYISSKSTEKVYIPQEVNDASTTNFSDGNFIINSTSYNSKSLNLHNANLSFVGNSFFAISISADSDSTLDLQNASSLTVEIIEGDITILCSNDRKTNLYISKPSNFSKLVISNDTDFFALNCTIDDMTVFPSNGNSEIISLNLFDSHLNIKQANLANCSIVLANQQLSSEDFDLKNTLFTEYNTIIENPDISINDINYQGNVTFSGKSILLLTNKIQLNSNSNPNPSILLSNEPSKFTVSDGIFILIDSTEIESSSIEYDHVNLMVLQIKGTNLKFNNLYSFSLIDFITKSNKFVIEINNENLTSDSDFYISTIGNSESIELNIDNTAKKINFLANLTESGSLSIEINSSTKSSFEMEIVKASKVTFTDFNNVFEMNYTVSKSDVSVAFDSIDFTINEADSDTFYLTYTMPSDNSSPTIDKVNNFKTIHIYDLKDFPEFIGTTDRIFDLVDCREIELDQSTAELIKTIKNSSVYTTEIVKFSGTFFYNCNLTSSKSFTFEGGINPTHETCFINMLNCSDFTVENYHSLYIENIIEMENECKITCKQSHLHISANDNNFICKLDDADSYIYINEENTSIYTIDEDGSGNFILKNANEIDEETLKISNQFKGSLFIYNCQNINISNDKFKDLSNLMILSSEFTIDSSLEKRNISFYNSTVFVDDPNIELERLVLYNSAIKPSDKMNVSDDELYGTLTIKDLLFNGETIVTDLNLWISHSVNNMANFYQEYKINQSVFTDRYNQEIHSKITMIPSDRTKITFGSNDDDTIVFGDNNEYSLFSFHGNSIMNNETLLFNNFEYFFSSVNFTNNKKLIGNIKMAEYPDVSFDTNETNITCPAGQKVIILNEREEENFTVFEVSCSSNLDYDNDRFLSSKNCTSDDEFNILTCFVENESEIEPISPKVIASNSFFETEDIFDCEMDSIKVTFNNMNDVKMNLNISNNCEVTFYDRDNGSFEFLNIINNSKLSIYRNVIDNTSLVMSDNCLVTILDTYDEYYRPPTNKSNTIGFLNLFSMNESSMNCNFKFNISTSSFYSSSCSFTNAEIFILKTENENNKEKEEEVEAYGKLDKTLVLKNAIINISKDVETVQFTDFQYNGKLNSIIYIYGNANFSGICHSNGIINCPNKETILDFTETDSTTSEIILYDLQISCTLNFSQAGDSSGKLHLGGNNSIISEGTIFSPSNLAIFVEGKISLYDFNMIDSITYFSNYSNIINDSFIDVYYGRPVIIFSSYKEHEIGFNISGQANVTVLDDNITFTKSFETYNDSAITFTNFIVFQEGATFNGHHVIEGTFDSLNDKSIEKVLWTDKFFIFNEFSCEGNSLVTVESDNIEIKDQHNENDTILFESIQNNLLKIQQMYNLTNFFEQKEADKTKNDEELNENTNNQTDDDEIDTTLDWKNIKIKSTNNFLIDLFSHRLIKFHHNEIYFNNTNIKLYGGYIRDVSLLTAVNSQFDVKDDYIESQTCIFTDSMFTNYMSSFGCTKLTSKNTQFNGYVDIYQPKIIDMINVTVNLSLPNNYPLFNIHNVKIEEEEFDIEKVSLLSENINNDIFDLKIRAELNINRNEINHETAKLFMFDVMPNSLPIVTTTETTGQSTEYLFNSEIMNNRIITFKSLKCQNSGRYDTEKGTCILCENGTYSYEDECIESPAGMFVNTQMKSNRNCPFGFYNDQPGQATCTKCPNHMITMKEGSRSKSDCVCDVGYMLDESFSSKDDEKCIKCPEGLACNKPNTLINNVKILEGYYYYNKDFNIAEMKNEFNITDENLTKNLNSSYIFKCLTSDVCLSQIQSNIRLTQCRNEYNGFLCSKCKKNYYHISITNCKKCSKFPIAALVFGPIIHVGLIFLCFIYDSRYCAFLYFFMLFTQHYSNIYQIDIKWPPIFTYVTIIFESINLDFHRFFDCEANDEIWSQGFIFMIINCAFIATYIVFFILDFKKYMSSKSGQKNESCDSNNCCRKKGDNKYFFKYDDDEEKLSTRIIQILTVYYFMTFLTQFRWILSAIASKNGHLIVYPYVIIDSFEYKSHIVVIIINCIYFFGFLLFFLGVFLYFYACRPISIMFLMFKYLLFDVKYEFTFLPFVYVAKSILMCFFVVYLNQSWFINLYLIVVLIICLEFFLYARPFYNKYIRNLELCNILFQMFIVSMGIMAQQIHSSFEIFSIVLMAVFSAFIIFVYIYCIIKYRKKLKTITREKEDYNNRDPSKDISKKEIFIKYRNEFNQFFFYDEKFDLNIIAEWLTSANLLIKSQMYYSYFQIRYTSRVQTDFSGIANDVNSLMMYYKEIFISFYHTRDSRGKKEIQELLDYAKQVKIGDTFMKSFMKFIFVYFYKLGLKFGCSKEKDVDESLYDHADKVVSKLLHTNGMH